MARPDRDHIKLSKGDRLKVEELLKSGREAVRTVVRALTLQRLDEGRSGREVASSVGLSAKTVRQIRKRYQAGGLNRALYDRPRPGADPLLNASQKQRIIALVCSEPPAGWARWTVRLIAAEAVKRKLVARVGRETIRVLLQSHDLQPWRGKNVVRRGSG
jgi:transposase